MSSSSRSTYEASTQIFFCGKTSWPTPTLTLSRYYNQYSVSWTGHWTLHTLGLELEIVELLFECFDNDRTVRSKVTVLCDWSDRHCIQDLAMFVFCFGGFYMLEDLLNAKNYKLNIYHILFASSFFTFYSLR